MDLDQDPCLPHQDIQARNYLIACFAVSLVRGETINSNKIRHATVRNYVNAAASLHTDRKLPSPYSAPIDYITIVLKAIKKYEKQPRRRDMIYDEMFHQMEHTRHQYEQNSLEAALIDWIYLGRFVGFRGIEWCQETQHEYKTIDHPGWEGPKSYAFIADDFQFFTTDKRQVHTLSDESIKTIAYVVIRFRKQKNNRNYEIIPYYRDEQNPSFCPVAAAIRIRLRATRLDVKSEEPLGVFHCQKGQYKGTRCYIATAQVATFLQASAMTVFHLKPKDELLTRYTTHSIRVTACNLLHRQGMSDTYIQSRLRWTSDAFLGYLRNTLYTAAAHTKALHIPASNLPILTDKYKKITLPSGEVVKINSPTGTPLVRNRTNEELENVLHARAA